jgi:hypothetical protein
MGTKKNRGGRKFHKEKIHGSYVSLHIGIVITPP